MTQHFVETIPGFALAVVSLVLGMIIGVSYGPVVGQHYAGQRRIDLSDAIATADNETDWRVWSRVYRFIKGGRRSAVVSNDNDQAKLFGGVLLVAVVVDQYVTRATVVANVLIAGSVTLVLATTWAFAMLKRRDVVEGRALARTMILNLPLTAIGIVDALWLLRPRVGGNRLEVVQHSLSGGHGVFGAGLTDFLFILYQVIGAFCVIVVAITGMATNLASVMSVYVHVQAFGLPIWRILYWLTGWSTRRRIWLVITVLALLSLALTSGELFQEIEKIGSNSQGHAGPLVSSAP